MMAFISPRKKLLQSVDWDEQDSDGALPGGDDWIAVSQPASPDLYAIKMKQRELLSPAQREPGSFYPTDSFDLQGQQISSPTVSPRATGGGAGGGKVGIMPPRSAMATLENTTAAPIERPRTASARLEYLSLPKRRVGGGGGGGGRRSSTQIMVVGEGDEPTTTTTTTTKTTSNIVHGTPHKGLLFTDDNPLRPQDDEDVFSRGGGAGGGGSRGSAAGAGRQRPHTALHVTSSKTASATRPSTATSRVSTWAPEREYLAHFTQRQGRVAGKREGGQEAGNANLVWMKNTGLVDVRSNIATRRLEEKNLPWPPKGIAMSRREVEAAASLSRKRQLAESRARLCARTGKTGRGGAMMIQAMVPDEERRTSLSGRMIPRPVQGKWGLMEMLTYQPAAKPPPVGRRMDISGLRTSKTSYLHRHMRDLKAAGSEAVMSLHLGSAADIRRARSSVGLSPPGGGEGWGGAWRAPPPPRGWGVDIVKVHAGDAGFGGGGGGGGEEGKSEEGFGCASRPLSAKSLPLEDGAEMPTIAELLRADLSAGSGSKKQFDVFVPSPLPSPLPTMDGQDLKRIMSTTESAPEARVVSSSGAEAEALAENCLLASGAGAIPAS